MTMRPHDENAIARLSARLCEVIRAEDIAALDVLATTFSLTVAQCAVMRERLSYVDRETLTEILTDYIAALTIVRDAEIVDLQTWIPALVRES